MSVIYKYPIMFGAGGYNLALPRGAVIVDVGIQNGEACLWAIVEVGRPDEIRRIGAFWTGQHFDYKHGMLHLKTFTDDGGLVWHIFEDTR